LKVSRHTLKVFKRSLAFVLCLALLPTIHPADAQSSRGFINAPRPHNFRDYTLYAHDIRRLLFRPPHSLIGETELACLAVAVYHEARGEQMRGQEAVASVIAQRALVPHRWGRTPCAVVRPVQFSFMQDRSAIPPIKDQVAWALALTVAVKTLVEGPLPDLEGADHYHTEDVSPSWPAAMEKVDQIGAHIFYRDPLSFR
jgi:spore germination cell wall hydrolase CwlJ-like protein